MLQNAGISSLQKEIEKNKKIENELIMIIYIILHYLLFFYKFPVIFYTIPFSFNVSLLNNNLKTYKFILYLKF